MRFTAFLTIAALLATCFVGGGGASETGTFVQSGHAATHGIPVADPVIARELPQQSLLPPPVFSEARAIPAEAPSKSDGQPLRIAIPPQGPPA